MVISSVLINVYQVERLLHVDAYMKEPARMYHIELYVKAPLDHSGGDHNQHAADFVLLLFACRVHKVEFWGTPIRVV